MRIFLFILFGLIPFLANAQPTAPILQEEQAVGIAIKNNPRVDATLHSLLAAKAGVRAAGSLANPTFFVAPALGNINGTTEELLFSQPLEINGTRSARRGVAQAQLRVVQSDAFLELRNLIAATRSAYYELARARELQNSALSLLKTIEEFDRLTRRQVELGSRPGIDQTQTALEAERARQQVTLAEGQVSIAQAALNAQMGRLPAETIAPLAPLEALITEVKDKQKSSYVLSSHPEITRAEANRDVFLQEVRLGRAEGRPDLAPQFRVQQFGTPDYGISVAITLPVFDWGGRRTRIQQSEASAKAQESRILSARLLVQQEISQAEARHRATRRVVESYQNGLLEQARRLVSGTEKGFQTGAPGTTLLSVLEAQRTYRLVQTEYLNALANLALAQVEQERASGVLSPQLLRQMPTTIQELTPKGTQKP